jgi:hypothetical protein
MASDERTSERGIPVADERTEVITIIMSVASVESFFFVFSGKASIVRLSIPTPFSSLLFVFNVLIQPPKHATRLNNILDVPIEGISRAKSAAICQSQSSFSSLYRARARAYEIIQRSEPFRWLSTRLLCSCITPN